MLHNEYLATLETAKQTTSPDNYLEVKEQILEKFSLCLGPRCWSIYTGSAPVSDAVLAFMKTCFFRSDVGVSYVRIFFREISANFQ
jgi:hypothetical protein